MGDEGRVEYTVVRASHLPHLYLWIHISPNPEKRHLLASQSSSGDSHPPSVNVSQDKDVVTVQCTWLPSLSFPLPGIDVKQASNVPSLVRKDHIYIKLLISRAPTPPKEGPSTNVAVDADLVKMLYCDFCGQQLLSNTLRKTMSLPSKYWRELSDLWNCCGTNGFGHLTQKEIAAKPGYCLMGLTHLLVHGDDVLLDHTDYSNQKQVFCSRCNTSLGFEESDSCGMQFFKHRVSTVDDPGSSLNAFSDMRLESVVAKDLITQSQAHACYRFLIMNNDKSSHFLQVTILNWQGGVQSSLLSRDDDNFVSLLSATQAKYSRTALHGVVSVAFRRCHGQDKKLVREWLVTKGAEPVYYSFEECHNLVTLLEDNMKIIPPSLRQHLEAGFSLSYLFL